MYRKYRLITKNVISVLRNTLSLKTTLQYIFYNCFVTNIVNNYKSKGLVFSRKCCIQIEKNSKIEISGVLYMGYRLLKKSQIETRLLLMNKSILTINGVFSMYGGSYILILDSGHLILNSGFINENVQITCASRIEIGNGCAIGRDVIIRDWDSHVINGDFENISKPIFIGNHVWIGQRATILKEVRIGDGAIVASGAIVSKDVPPRTIVAGVPARVIKTDVTWE